MGPKRKAALMSTSKAPPVVAISHDDKIDKAIVYLESDTVFKYLIAQDAAKEVTSLASPAASSSPALASNPTTAASPAKTKIVNAKRRQQTATQQAKKAKKAVKPNSSARIAPTAIITPAVSPTVTSKLGKPKSKNTMIKSKRQQTATQQAKKAVKPNSSARIAPTAIITPAVSPTVTSKLGKPKSKNTMIKSKVSVYQTPQKQASSTIHVPAAIPTSAARAAPPTKHALTKRAAPATHHAPAASKFNNTPKSADVPKVCASSSSLLPSYKKLKFRKRGIIPLKTLLQLKKKIQIQISIRLKKLKKNHKKNHKKNQASESASTQLIGSNKTKICSNPKYENGQLCPCGDHCDCLVDFHGFTNNIDTEGLYYDINSIKVEDCSFLCIFCKESSLKNSCDTIDLIVAHIKKIHKKYLKKNSKLYKRSNFLDYVVVMYNKKFALTDDEFKIIYGSGC